MIIIPPIVGVPSFLSSPSRPSSLTFSPTCLIFKKLIIFFPKTIDITSDIITVTAALNDK